MDHPSKCIQWSLSTKVILISTIVHLKNTWTSSSITIRNLICYFFSLNLYFQYTFPTEFYFNVIYLLCLEVFYWSTYQTSLRQKCICKLDFAHFLEHKTLCVSFSSWLIYYYNYYSYINQNHMHIFLTSIIIKNKSKILMEINLREFFKLVYVSMADYYLWLEQNKIQSESYSYFLIFLHISTEKTFSCI